MSGSNEVNEAVGATEHDAEIAQLQSELSEPSEREQKAARLAALEAARAAKRAAQFVAVAEKRRVGIKRGAGSLADQVDQDAQRFIAAVEAVVAAARTFGERFEQYEKYRAEEAALVDRFGLDISASLPVLVAPAVRAAVVAAYDQLRGLWLPERTDAFKPQVEQDETGLRQRRTYGEIAGTPGYATILDAGLPEFPALSERQREMLAERERQQATAQRQLARAASEAPAALAESALRRGGDTSQ